MWEVVKPSSPSGHRHLPVRFSPLADLLWVLGWDPHTLGKSVRPSGQVAEWPSSDPGWDFLAELWCFLDDGLVQL